MWAQHAPVGEGPHREVSGGPPGGARIPETLSTTAPQPESNRNQCGTGQQHSALKDIVYNATTQAELHSISVAADMLSGRCFT